MLKAKLHAVFGIPGVGLTRACRKTLDVFRTTSNGPEIADSMAVRQGERCQVVD